MRTSRIDANHTKALIGPSEKGRCLMSPMKEEFTTPAKDGSAPAGTNCIKSQVIIREGGRWQIVLSEQFYLNDPANGFTRPSNISAAVFVKFGGTLKEAKQKARDMMEKANAMLPQLARERGIPHVLEFQTTVFDNDGNEVYQI